MIMAAVRRQVMLKFDDLVEGAIYEIFHEDGVGIGCGERDEIKGLADIGVFGATLDTLRFKRAG